ncbi:MAG: hypothetical protein B7X80_08725 [Sulfurovum sp. 17-42-90]|nr:MAG: hypothetical protein B7X80_08725 [Sulfurovum sp. 17-42-90]
MTTTNTEHGFNIATSINFIDSVKPRPAGTSKMDGETIEWGNAVKFRARNIDIVPDKDFGEKELETTLEIEIPCHTLSDAVQLNNFLKTLKNDKKPFQILTTIPSNNNGVYTCKSKLTAIDFMNSIKK